MSNIINMVNKDILDMSVFYHDKDKKIKFYNELVYLIYGVNSDKIYFKDNNKCNLSKDNCIVINNFHLSNI